tara:strand:- start:344 stop:589 length:246 start_codon:yes stop_codon:yes gene_type:complete
MTFRDWIGALCAEEDTAYGHFAFKAFKGGWKGTTTRSLKQWMRAREFDERDSQVFRHICDVWGAWVSLRSIWDRNIYLDYD